MEALEAFDVSGQEALVCDVEDLVHRFNRLDDKTMVVPIDYLEVMAVRRYSYVMECLERYRVLVWIQEGTR